MGDPDKRDDLDYWILCLQRFSNRQPLPKSLQHYIERDFNFYQNNDRNQYFNDEISDLKHVPDKIKMDIAVNYLFIDMILTFRRFFDYALASGN